MRSSRISSRMLVILVILGFIALSGCALNPPPKNTPAVNIAVVLYPGGGGPPAVLTLYKAALAVTNATSGEYKLNLITVSPPLDQMRKSQAGPLSEPPTIQALEQALSQDPAPDVVLFTSTYEFTSAVAKELLLDIDQYLRGDKVAPREDYFPGTLEAVTESGRLYGLPLAGGPMVMQYDRRLFDAAGLEAPSGKWSWSEFVDAGRRLTKVTGSPATDQYAISLSFGPPALIPFIWQNGGELLSKDGRRALFGEPAAIEAIKFYFDLTDSYKVAAPMPKAGQGKEGMAAAMPAIARPAVGGPNEAPPLFGPGGRVAMTLVSNAGNWYGAMPYGAGGDRPLRYTELPRGKVQATLLDVQAVVAVTGRARDPRLAYKAASALSIEMQKELPVPALRPVAKRLRQINPAIEEDDAQVVLNAMEYGRPLPMAGSQKFMQPFYEKLLNPLQSGTKTPAEAVREAVEAVDRSLNQ